LLKPVDEAEKDSVQNRNSSMGSRYQVDLETDVSEAQRAALTDKVKTKQLDGVIWATDDALAANKVSFITRDVAAIVDREIVNQKLSRAAERLKLQKKGLSGTDIDAALKPVEMETVSATGKGATNPLATYGAVLSMVMIMYISVLLYGINVMRAVLDEKTSRIMEVMLSTATPNQMMVGKILGVGAVGLTQIGIWALTAAGPSMGLLAAPGMLKGIITPKLLLYFPVFFL